MSARCMARAPRLMPFTVAAPANFRKKRSLSPSPREAGPRKVSKRLPTPLQHTNVSLPQPAGTIRDEQPRDLDLQQARAAIRSANYAADQEQNVDREIGAGPYELDAVMFGSGVDVGGRKFVRGRWYGCMTAVGDRFGYFPIILDSLTAPECGNRSVTFAAKPIAPVPGRVAPPKCVIPVPRSTRAQKNSTAQFDRMALECILSFCRRYPGVSVVTFGSGSRASNRCLEKFRVDGELEIIAGSGNLDCLPASIVNRVQYLCGSGAAECVRDKLIASGEHPTSLGRAGPLVQKLGLRVNVRKPKERKQLHATRYDRAFDVVGKWNFGLWIVRLTQTSGCRVDHCVLVNADKGIIIDSAELFAIRLCPESLRMCGGSNNSKLQLAEIRQLYIQ